MSTTLRSEKPIVAPSKLSSANGIAITSPSTKRAALRASSGAFLRAFEHRRAEVDAGHVERRIAAQQAENEVAGPAAAVEDPSAAAAVRADAIARRRHRSSRPPVRTRFARS